MKYRTRLDLIFETQGVAAGLVRLIIDLLDEAIIINEGLNNEERGFIELEDCYHDEDLPCLITDRWEVGRGKVI